MSSEKNYPFSDRGPVDHEVRDQILQAAAEHFSRYGYVKTTVSELAKSIGYSKAYIYKFFPSKQAIGEMICAGCLGRIEKDVQLAVAEAEKAPEKLRRLFKSIVEASLRLFIHDRKLYEIAVSAASERWQSVLHYDQSIQRLLQEILQQGRADGDFERKTPMDETVASIYLVLRPYINPMLLQLGSEHAEEEVSQLSSLVLRSLSP